MPERIRSVRRTTTLLPGLAVLMISLLALYAFLAPTRPLVDADQDVQPIRDESAAPVVQPVRDEGHAPVDLVLESLRLETKKTEERIAEANRLKEQARASVFMKALEMEEWRKQQAHEERVAVESKIEWKELEIERKKWALNRFDLAERSLIPAPSATSSLMQRWERHREMAKTKFLHFPQQARGAIKSGRALNFFLEACGPTAQEHLMYRKQMLAELDVPHLPAAERDEIEERLRVLDSVRTANPLFEKELRDIAVQRGLSGPKLVSRLRIGTVEDDIFPLEWPVYLRNDGRYDNLLEQIESARERALEDLKATSYGVSADVQRDLLTAIDDLQSEFDRAFKTQFDQLRVKVQRGDAASGAAAADMVLTRRFLKQVRDSATRLLAARTTDDVQAEPFEGTCIDELLAFMSRHCLRFAPADLNSEASYEALFEAMSAYYVDLYGLTLAIEMDEQKVQALEERAEKLFDIEYDSVLDELARTDAGNGFAWSVNGTIGFSMHSQ